MKPTVQAALECLKSGDTLGARAACQEVLKLDPENARAWHLCGVTHAQEHELKEAVECFGKAVALDKKNANYHYNLGLAFRGLDRRKEAIASYRTAIECNKEFLEARNNLANTLLADGNQTEAIDCFRELAEHFPDDAVTHYNLGNALQDFGQIDEAIHAYRRAIECDPEQSSARENLGRVFSDTRRFEEAKKVWQEWLAHEPQNSIAKHMLAGITGEGIPNRCDDEFVRQAFDVDFAESFEQQLANLDYKGPALMKQAIDLLDLPGDARILDAGCGTGLSAPDLRPLAKTLVGVDLSPDMLLKADQRNLYDELIEDELTRFFDSRKSAFDLILCSDTLCYFGELEEVMAAARGCLVDKGTFVFSVERVRSADEAIEESNEDENKDEDEDKILAEESDEPPVERFDLQPHGRYRHLEAYVIQCVENAGFSVDRAVRETLRMERGREVDGLVVTAVAK